MSGDATPEIEEAVSPEPLRKRKKKKRKAAGSALDLRAGWPPFARAFPLDPELKELVEAFEQGNYARVREGAQRLLAMKEDASDDVRSAVRELVRRTSPDPIAVYLLVGASLLLAFLSLWYWSHSHGSP